MEDICATVFTVRGALAGANAAAEPARRVKMAAVFMVMDVGVL